MLATNFKQWGVGDRRKNAFVPLLGHGIFTTDGAAWHASRELLRPNFARTQVGDLATFEIHITQLLKAIPRDGSTVDLQDLFFQLTMDSATEFLFGESTNCLDPKSGPENMEFTESFNRAQDTIAQTFRTGIVHKWLRRKTFAKDVACCQEFVDRFVQKGLEYRRKLEAQGMIGEEGEKADQEGERYVFLHELVKHTKDPVQIRSELLNILLAGRDSTASLLSDVWFVLARRPDIWAKLRAEVDALGGEKPTYQQIKDMKYLRMVLNECTSSPSPIPSPLKPPAYDPLICPSQPALPHRSRQQPHRHRRYRPPPRRWPRRQIPPLHSSRPDRPVEPLHHAPPPGLLRPRCRRIPPRALGETASGVGVFAFQWGTEDLYRTAVCAHRGELYDCKVDAGVWRGGEPG